MFVDYCPHKHRPIDRQQDACRKRSCQQRWVAERDNEGRESTHTKKNRDEYNHACCNAPTDQLERVEIIEGLPENGHHAPEHVGAEGK